MIILLILLIVVIVILCCVAYHKTQVLKQEIKDSKTELYAALRECDKAHNEIDCLNRELKKVMANATTAPPPPYSKVLVEEYVVTPTILGYEFELHSRPSQEIKDKVKQETIKKIATDIVEKQLYDELWSEDLFNLTHRYRIRVRIYPPLREESEGKE